MRLFKRNLSDSSPRLVSLSPIIDIVNERDIDVQSELGSGLNFAAESTEVTVPAVTSTKSYKNGLSTWSKKVGQKWEQLKRSDSSEFLLKTGSKSRQWSPNNHPTASNASASSDTETNPTRKRISRVESLRNLFLRQEKSVQNSESRRKSDKTDSGSEMGKSSPCPLRRHQTNRSINDNLTLSEKQLLEYLLLCKPSDRIAIVKELIETLSESSKSKNVIISPIRSSYKKNFMSVKRFFRRSLSEGSITNNTITNLLGSQNMSPSVDELCSVLNRILIDSASQTDLNCSQSSETLEMKFDRDSLSSMRRSNSSGSFTSYICESGQSICASQPNAVIPETVGPEDDTDSADESMFEKPPKSYFQPTRSVKRLRRSSGSGSSIHKRQIVKCNYRTDEGGHHSESTCYIDKEFKSIRLNPSELRQISLASEKSEHNSSISILISNISSELEVAKYGKIQIGDAIIKINGKRLRGLSLEEVENEMYNSNVPLELIISRYPKKVQSSPKKSVSPKSKTGQLQLSATPAAPTGMKKFLTSRRHSIVTETAVRSRRSSSSLNRPKSLCSEVKVTYFKGPGRKSLGFSVVGGSDSPRGNIGIYVKTVFARGQAADEGTLQAGDEIISVNGISLQGLTHSEAINVFKNIKYGEVNIEILRRDATRH